MENPRKLKKVRKGRIHLHCHQGFSVHLSPNDHISLDFCAPKLHNKKQTLSSKMPSLWYVVKASKESRYKGASVTKMPRDLLTAHVY